MINQKNLLRSRSQIAEVIEGNGTSRGYFEVTSGLVLDDRKVWSINYVGASNQRRSVGTLRRTGVILICPLSSGDVADDDLYIGCRELEKVCKLKKVPYEITRTARRAIAA